MDIPWMYTISTCRHGYEIYLLDVPWKSHSEYPQEIHITISHGCQFRNIHTKSTDRYPVDVPSGYPYEIHRTISHGCQFRISIRNPQTEIPWMSISEYPYEIHRTKSHGI